MYIILYTIATMSLVEDSFYLTDKLVIKEGKAYKLNIHDKLIKINERSWLKWLGEYGWEKLDNGWIRRMNRYIKKEERSRFCRWGVLDCGSNGDCLFEVVAEAINQSNYFDPKAEITDVQLATEIRAAAADQVDDDNFNLIIESYKAACETGEFYEAWDPYDIETPKELRAALRTKGHTQWGDYIMLQLLQQALNINFIILNSEHYDGKTLKERFTIHSSGLGLDPSKKTIILYYVDDFHFQLIGYFKDDHLITLFDYDQIPKELMAVYRNDTNLSMT
jgi:hypothetical protein